MPNLKVQRKFKIKNDRGDSHAEACHSRPVSRYGVNSIGDPLTHPSPLRGEGEGWIPDQVRNDELKGRRGGFTLIEVVVATAILAIALTVIIELFAGGLRLARVSKEYTKAVNYANAKMEEIASRQTLEEGSTEGEFDETFRWRVTMDRVNLLPVERPWEVKPPIQLFKIRVDVLWKPGSQERSASVETYRAMKVKDEDEKKS